MFSRETFGRKTSDVFLRFQEQKQVAYIPES